MRLVAYFPKSVYNTDNSGIALKVAINLRNAIKGSNFKILAKALKADYISVDIDDINIDRYNVWEDEYDGVNYDVPSTHAIIAIDYSIEVGATDSCLISYGCNDVDIVITDGVIEVIEIEEGDTTKWINATLPAILKHRHH